MIVDLLTGETFGAILYQDAADVILWTLPPGESQARESAVTAAQLVEPVTFPAEAPGWAILARFQEVGGGATLPAAAAERRAALEAYAQSNGGQIRVHQPENRPAGLARLTRWGRDLFAGLP